MLTSIRRSVDDLWNKTRYSNLYNEYAYPGMHKEAIHKRCATGSSRWNSCLNQSRRSWRCCPCPKGYSPVSNHGGLLCACGNKEWQKWFAGKFDELLPLKQSNGIRVVLEFYLEDYQTCWHNRKVLRLKRGIVHLIIRMSLPLAYSITRIILSLFSNTS